MRVNFQYRAEIWQQKGSWIKFKMQPIVFVFLFLLLGIRIKYGLN